MRTMNSRPTISRLGDSTVRVQFGDEINVDRNRQVQALDARLRKGRALSPIDTVPAYATLLVHYDPLALTYAQAAELVQAELDQIAVVTPPPSSLIEIPVRYGGEEGPDLDFVANYPHLTASSGVRMHASTQYLVSM